MTVTKSIGVLGSAFDPPTLGHRDVIEQAAAHFDLILLLPCAAHAFNKQPLPFDIRLEMLETFAKELGDSGIAVEVSDIERDIAHHNPEQAVRTWDVMTWLEKLYQQSGESVSLSFIRGPDNANPATWQRFYRWQDIENNWSLFTAKERVAARSSEVRSLLQRNSPQNIEHLVTPAICRYILEHQLYQPESAQGL
ncbi:adenylyltransferase/cytidyltransferase family protein [Endozoicomonadaceae bacterium StTr2]